MQVIIVRTNIGLIAIFSLVILVTVPVYADVKTAVLDKQAFTLNDDFIISGTVSNDDRGLIVAAMKGPSNEKLVRNAFSSGTTFEFTAIAADNFFKTKGIYTINVFTESQRPANGTIIKIEFESGRATVLPDFELILKPIGNKRVDEGEKLAFTASITDSQITDEKFRLRNNPNGATINERTGVFSWTPTDSQAGGYIFDIIVEAYPLEERETITVTVSDKPVPKAVPPVQPKAEPKPEPEPKVAEPKKLGPASFVDSAKDPQSYVDRYNAEPTYKKWFDDNFSEYDSIHQAVGLEEPGAKEPEIKEPAVKEPTVKEPAALASFVDSAEDPQIYVDRYNAEPTYKKWFDDNFAEYDSIYQAVGLEKPVAKEPEMVKENFGECDEGTDLVKGVCVVVSDSKGGGGCLIATAAYGTEMAPQVQLLREIRDNQLMGTDSGVSFMTGFNQLYYSFSPHIADMQRENPAFREMVKIGITPLLSTLHIMSHAETESQVVSYGIGVILMNLGMYVGIPAIIIVKTRKYIKI